MKSIICNTDEIHALQRGSTLIVRPVDWKDIYKQSGCTKGKLAYSDTFKSWAVFNGNGDADLCLVDCPYGEELIVKETALYWRNKYMATHVAAFKADGYELEPGEKWTPAQMMPNRFSRYTIKIKDVRLKRCQEVTQEESVKAGFDEEICEKVFVDASKGISVVDEYWIEDSDEVDSCMSYCERCATKKAESSGNVRFGGNCESDGPPFCDECYAPLDMALTSYGVSNELRLCDENPEKYFPCSGSDAAIAANISSGIGDLSEEHLGRLAQIGCATHLVNRFSKKGFSWERNDHVWIIEHGKVGE